jgi:hypothetical protein
MTTRTLLLLHALFSLCLLVNLLGCMWWNLAVTEGLVDSWATASECSDPGGAAGSAGQQGGPSLGLGARCACPCTCAAACAAACATGFLAAPDRQPATSWTARHACPPPCMRRRQPVSPALLHLCPAVTKDFDLLTASDGARWLVSCYFALTTMVTIGEAGAGAGTTKNWAGTGNQGQAWECQGKLNE